MQKFLKFITERNYSIFDLLTFGLAIAIGSFWKGLTIIFVGLIISAVLEVFADN